MQNIAEIIHILYNPKSYRPFLTMKSYMKIRPSISSVERNVSKQGKIQEFGIGLLKKP